MHTMGDPMPCRALVLYIRFRQYIINIQLTYNRRVMTRTIVHRGRGAHAAFNLEPPRLEPI